MKCLHCQKNEAIIHPSFGVVFCTSCQDSLSEKSSPNVHPPEFVGDSVNYERKAFNRDIIQKYRHGELSKEWVDAYPDKARKQHSADELKGAKRVWKGDL